MEQMDETRGRPKKGEEKNNAITSVILASFGVKQAIMTQARALLRELPETFQQVKAGDITVGAAYPPSGAAPNCH